MSEDAPKGLQSSVAGGGEFTEEEEEGVLEEAFIFPEERDEQPPETYDIPAGRVKQAVLDGVEAAFDGEQQTKLPTPDREAIETSFFEWPPLDRSSELGHYWVNRPYAFVSVLFDEENRKYRYYITEPTLDDFEEYVYRDLKTVIRDVLLYRDIEEADREQVFETEVTDLLAEYGEDLPAVTLRKLQYYLTRDFVGYADTRTACKRQQTRVDDRRGSRSGRPQRDRPTGSTARDDGTEPDLGGRTDRGTGRPPRAVTDQGVATDTHADYRRKHVQQQPPPCHRYRRPRRQE